MEVNGEYKENGSGVTCNDNTYSQDDSAFAEDNRSSRALFGGGLKKQDSVNSGALLLNVNKKGSQSDIDVESEKDAKQSPGKSSKTIGSQQLCKVLLLDGTDYEVNIPKTGTGRDLAEKVCDYLALREREYFSCTYRENDKKVWLIHDKPIYKQLKKSAWVFAFEVKFYPQDPTILRDEITRYQIYLQTRVDALSARLPMSFVSHAVLGSFAVQSQLGDQESDVISCDYLKCMRFAPQQTDELLDRIAELHRFHRGMSPAEAELSYLNNVKNMALYGVHSHLTKDANNVDTYVGVCAAGLLVYQHGLRIKRYVWPRIIKIAYKRNIFIIQVRDQYQKKTHVTEHYKLSNVKLAKRFWKLAAEHHTFFRLRESVQAGERNLFWRKNYRFSGHTQYQALQAAAGEPHGEGGRQDGAAVNRATGGRFTDRLRSVDMLSEAGMFSTERSEETMDYRTMTLEIKHKNKRGTSVGNSLDDGQETNQKTEGHAELDGSTGRVVYSKGVQNGVHANGVGTTMGSMGDVFMGGGTEENYRNTLDAQRRSQVNFVAPSGGQSGVVYSKTPYPDDSHGAIGPDFESDGGFTTPGGDRYTLEGQGHWPLTANRRSNDMDQTDMGFRSNSHDDHLKQHRFDGAGYELGGSEYNTADIKTSTRSYTAPDGTIVTEVRTEKNGVVETRIEKRMQINEEDEGVDYEQALREAIKSVTDMSDDLTVEKIEIQTKQDD